MNRVVPLAGSSRQSTLAARVPASYAMLSLLLRAALLISLPVQTTAQQTVTFYLNFTQLRDSTRLRGGGLQIAEVRLWAADGSQVGITQASNPGGSAPYPGQVAARSIDGSVSTKWSDVNFTSVGSSLLELTLASTTVQPIEYELVTANDHPARDPVSWTAGVLSAGVRAGAVRDSKLQRLAS